MRKKAKAKSNRNSSPEIRVHGQLVPAFGDEVLLIRKSRFHAKKGRQKDAERTKYLVGMVGAEMQLPGIKPTAIFKNTRSRVFAYSIDPKNPNRIVRQSSAGKRTVGRFVDGRFKAL